MKKELYEKLLQKLNFYKNHFSIKQKEIFEQAIKKPRDLPLHTLELSHKIENNRANSCRITFFCSPSVENIKDIQKVKSIF